MLFHCLLFSPNLLYPVFFLSTFMYDLFHAVLFCHFSNISSSVPCCYALPYCAGFYFVVVYSGMFYAVPFYCTTFDSILVYSSVFCSFRLQSTPLGFILFYSAPSCSQPFCSFLSTLRFSCLCFPFLLRSVPCSPFYYFLLCSNLVLSILCLSVLFCSVRFRSFLFSCTLICAVLLHVRIIYSILRCSLSKLFHLNLFCSILFFCILSVATRSTSHRSTHWTQLTRWRSYFQSNFKVQMKAQLGSLAFLRLSYSKAAMFFSCLCCGGVRAKLGPTPRARSGGRARMCGA